MKSLFIIYTDFESTLVPEEMESKIQKNLIQANIKKYFACNYGYKLACFYNMFSKRFKL